MDPLPICEYTHRSFLVFFCIQEALMYNLLWARCAELGTKDTRMKITW